MSDWNPELYLKFEKERTQPAKDLINRIDVQDPKNVIDIGCGAGNSTHALSMKFPKAKIMGIDNSPKMIQRACLDYPECEFVLCDASRELSTIKDKYDIVFSNACLQWLPKHDNLIKEMTSLLNPGGVLAVQMPINNEEPLYKIISDVVSNKRWGFQTSNLETNMALKSSEYHDVLSDLSTDFSIWETTYLHRMKSCANLVEWVKSTNLRPYLNTLSPELASCLEKEIEEKAAKEYVVQNNGEIIFRFKRLFFTLQLN